MSNAELTSTFARWVATMREELAPAADDPSAKLIECEDCGDTFAIRKGDDRNYCPWCGAARQVSAQDQMSGRYGPIYEKAALKQHAYWTAELDRLGLKPGG